MNLKAIVRQLLPPRLLSFAQRVRVEWVLREAYRYDRARFMRFSSSLNSGLSKQNLASRLTEAYHNIEKGLSLPDPRPGFGTQAVSRLVNYAGQYLATYGRDEVVDAACGALDAYVSFNRQSGLTDQDIPHLEAIDGLLERVPATRRVGGTKSVTRSEVLTAVSGTGESFFLTRSSVRQFAQTVISDDDLLFAVRVAQKSPAVCNRQYGRVYVIDRPRDVIRALEIQGGARGFASQVPALAVITTNIRNFWGAGERMQAWTDGGMFAMSFVLGLHARGLGSVCLNWSKTEATDREFHREFGLPDEEVIVMLIAFGHLNETYQVAVSPRRAPTETLRRI